MESFLREAAEALLLGGILALGLLPLVRFFRRRHGSPGGRIGAADVALVVLLAAAGAGLARVARPRPDLQLAEAVPEKAFRDGFRSSTVCRSCHPGEYASWHASYHRTMTQAAVPASVVGPFAGTRLQARGRLLELARRDDQFWARVTEEPAVAAGRPAEWSRVVMTTGSHHFQVYWLETPDGGFVQLPWLYNIDDSRWIPCADSFLQPDSTDADLAWSACSTCHTTDWQPRRNAAGAYEFGVAEMGISCEACHGPGEEHVRANRNPARRYNLQRDDSDRPDPTIINPEHEAQEVSAEICGQCHSFHQSRDDERAVTGGATFRAGERLTDHFIPGVLPGGAWSDGVVRVGGREFSAMSTSACYAKGSMTCLSCHSMHASEPDDQLIAQLEGNPSCVQCHAREGEDIEAHTHHAADSSGSECVNCHMPFTAYALFSAIRNHHIDSPRVRSRALGDRPNACNLCHLNRTLGWSARYLAEWYGQPEPASLDQDERNIAASLLWLLEGDAAQRVILAWNMGWRPAQEVSGNTWMAPYLSHLLRDPYAAVRKIAYSSLRTLPGFESFPYDFIDPPGKRNLRSQFALNQWKQQGAGTDEPLMAALLLEAGRQLREEEVKRLLSGRNDRDVVIAE